MTPLPADSGRVPVGCVDGTSDPVDATVVLLAGPGDRILTSDPGDIARLAATAGSRAIVIAC